MEQYVDGFLIPVPKGNLEQYKEIAEQAGKVWMEHGALAYYECVGDDLNKPDMVPFTQSAGASSEELVIFSWILYPSREARDRINAAVMADPRLAAMMTPDSPMPFDCKRMAYGGFKPLVVFEKGKE